MSYQEKRSIVNILSGLLITLIYALIVYNKHQSGQIDLTTDYKVWGIALLIFIGVSIVARIVIYIIFHIINAIATREEDVPVSDEREELIKLKANRTGHIAVTLSFVVGVALLSIGFPVYVIFISFVAGGILAEITDNSMQIYYHRKGI